METLDDIIKSAKSGAIDDDTYEMKTYEKEIVNYFEDKGWCGETIHQEPISLSVASALIPENEFDSECSYQLIMSPFYTLVIKVNEKEKDNSNPVSKRITEYEINTNDEVQTYEEMSKAVALNAPPSIFHNNTRLLFETGDAEYNEKGNVSSRAIVICCVTLILLLVLGVNLFFFVLNNQI